jgi:uncharacterized membrane protein YoaK (UPF0700 family)
VSPAWSKLLRRCLATSLIVGTLVSLGHHLFPGAPWWPVIHFLLPVIVFSLSAWRSGQRTLTRPLVLRGLATVATVGIAFTAINTIWTLPQAARVPLNYLVPFLVSLAGGASALKYPVRPPPRPAP